MSDIVALLRDPEMAGSQLDHQAADEIERLRGLLGALAQRHEWVSPGMGPCICHEHLAARAALATTDEQEPVDPRDLCDHEWSYTGTQYGGDDERWHGEGRVLCVKCGQDGDG